MTKKKKNPVEVVAPPLDAIDQAVEASDDAAAKVVKCSVCAEPVSPTSKENLCWVCRRLKLSAWRDMDAQMSVQE